MNKPDLLAIAEGVSSIGISGHEKPDGDAVGSCLALAMYLERVFKQQGKDVRIDVFLEPYSPALRRNVPGQEFVRTMPEARRILDSGFQYDLFFALDSSKSRLGLAEPLFDGAKRTVNIDHHISNPGSGDINAVDGRSSSACEVLYRLLDPALLDDRIAQALYVGLVTDTGVFRYSNTSPETMELGAALMRRGFDFSGIVQEVFFEKTFVQQKILGYALSRSRLILNGEAVLSSMSGEELSALGASSDMIEGISAELILTIGVKCAAFLHEDQENEWRVSLRSGKYADVSKIAEAFGGGGHVRASGCTIRGTREEVEAALEKEIAARIGTEAL